ncbi:hypothetical protein B0H13DRAFT_2069165 [Mycena leptocephala]|nr:hypothetical protein B0H13DRAFT_2069165 [Mycena leptocephala]
MLARQSLDAPAQCALRVDDLVTPSSFAPPVLTHAWDPICANPRLDRHFSFIRYLFASAASSLDCSVVSTLTVSAPVGRRSPPPPHDPARDIPRGYQNGCMYTPPPATQYLPPWRARRSRCVPVRPPVVRALPTYSARRWPRRMAARRVGRA